MKGILKQEAQPLLEQSNSSQQLKHFYQLHLPVEQFKYLLFPQIRYLDLNLDFQLKF